MNNSPETFNTVNNTEQVRQPSPEEIEKLGKSAYIASQETTQPIPVESTVSQSESDIKPTETEASFASIIDNSDDVLRGIGIETYSFGDSGTETIAEVSVDSDQSAPNSLLQEKLQLVKDTLNRVKDSLSDKAQGAVEAIRGAAKNFQQVVKVAFATISIATILAACSVGNAGNVQAINDPNAINSPQETTSISGELDNGLPYDYSGYNSPDKLNKNNFGEDLRKYHGDRDAMVNAVMSEAGKNPEMLVSLAYQILTPSQKQNAGINGMTITEIDEALNKENGIDLYVGMYKELSSAMNNAEIEFFEANGPVWSAFEYYIDENGDGKQTPDETHIGAGQVRRSSAKQFKVVNAPNDQEKTETNVNEYCGAQPDSVEKPEGVPEIGPDDPSPETPTSAPTEWSTETTSSWGKEGDPHGEMGEYKVNYSDYVDPNSEVSKEQNDNANKGNQGYVDDGQATPGSGSENNGTSNSDRLSGGENQGGSQMNGSNSYWSSEQTISGGRTDDSGNTSQSWSQNYGGENGNGAAPGGDNYSNAGEENPENW